MAATSYQTLDGVLQQLTRYVVAPCAFGLLGLSIVFSISDNLNSPYTSFRLAPSLALARGYPLYSLPDHPPWVTVGYGPFYPVAYLPCIFAKDPVTAVSAATILAYAYILVPVGLLSALFCRRFVASPNGARVSWVPIFLLFGMLAISVPSLAYVTTRVHVDAPALGLFLVASYFVLRAEEVSRRLSGHLTALAGISAGLSASCKVTLLAGVLALLLIVLWWLDWKRAAGFALSAVLTVCIVYGWIIVHDGFPAVVLNFQVLARFPWVVGHAGMLSTLVSDKILTSLSLTLTYLTDYGLLALVTLALIWLPTLLAAPKRTTPASQLVWFFLFTAFIVMPASIASLAKYGGDVNSRAIFTLPLVLAVNFAFWAAIVHQANSIGTLAACVVLTGAVLNVARSVPGRLIGLSLGNSIMEESYATVRDHPSQCYFPVDPLAHLLAGDRFRPNLDVIWSYAVGGYPVDKAAFQSSMPAGIKYVILPSLGSWDSSELRRLLPFQSAPTTDLNLEHHDVWSLSGKIRE